MSDSSTVIIGAGPAGLSAAHELLESGRSVTVLEQDPTHVGGLSRTVDYRGFRFDIGGHRFFSKNREIEDLWTAVLGERLQERARLSRIYYRGDYYKYPLEPFEALRKLGLREAIACLASYVAARTRAPIQCRTFEDWAIGAFGSRLYTIFFKTYTEKVWGVPCSEISKDWAAQRIRGLNLGSLLRSLLPSARRPVIKTLIERFRYPVLGPGEMWETLAERIRERGGAICLGERVSEIHRRAARITAVTTTGPHGERTHPAEHFISTMPIRELIAAFRPEAAAEVRDAARKFRYRAMVVVILIVDQAEVFRDNWIYIHDPSVLVGRIQNFKNWSAEMVPDGRYTALGLEYFTGETNELTERSDHELCELGKRELAALGIVDPRRVVDGTVVREPKAYPVYDLGYRENVDAVRDYLGREAENLQLVGRNGMHKYNNQDHAMLTGLMAARNIGGASYDLWRVNSDAEYLEGERTEEVGARVEPAARASTAA